MKMLVIVTFFTFINTLASPNTSGLPWTVSPFDQKVFIENKGQFDGKNGDSTSKVFYGTSVDGVDLYFSKTGVTYRHDKMIPMKEEKEKMDEREEEEKMMKSESHYLSIEWEGANPATEIITQDSVSFYYTYTAGQGTMSAHAYKKIIYKNLYHGIDVEYFFPEGKHGLKYSLLIHPGADVSQIKMRYKGAENLSLDELNNVVIKSSFGDFIDHAPTTTAEKVTVPSSVVINGNEVSFSVSPYDHTRELVIDPWTTNPNFLGFNAGYDVNYDLNGNVYVLGSYNPFKLAKCNSAGVVQWIFNVVADFGELRGAYYYGDFAVDEVSGASYIVEGFNKSNAARVIKVNTLGKQTNIFQGKQNMNEMWRVEYNRCIDKIVIAGGGTTVPSFNAAVLDTNLANIKFVQFFSTSDHTDMSLLAIDNNSNFCYMASSRYNSPNYDLKMFKCPIPNLVPSAFSVSDGCQFAELGSITYINGNTNGFINSNYDFANGMNGMAVSPSWLYTYDSDSLKRWNKNTGTYVEGIHVSLLPPNYFTGGLGVNGIQVCWGGLSVDECDNIYVGNAKSIKEYNNSLSLVNTFTLPDTVYDVKLGPNNKLYACGKGFVTAIDVVSNNTTIKVTQTPATCNNCDGTATVSAVSCGSNPTGFSYLWNTNPVQTTQTAIGLCPGTYTVTVSTNCFINFTDSVTVTGKETPTPVITGTTTLCQGDSTVLTASGGTTYLWSTGATTGSIRVQPLTTTKYIATVTNDSGCSASDTVTVTVTPRPNARAGSGVTICFGDSTQLTATGGTIYSWLPTTGLSNPNSVNPVAKPVVTTLYTVTVSNANICTSKDSVLVTVLPEMQYSLTPNPVTLGLTNVGKTKTRKAVFTNKNSSDVHIGNIHFTPSTFGTITTPFPQTLPAHDSLVIQFTGSAPDTFLYQGNLCIEVDSMCHDERCILVTIEGASTCLTPQAVSATIGKRPGEEVIIPIVLDPSTKFVNVKKIDVHVKYDPCLLHFISVTSSYDSSPKVSSTAGDVALMILPTRALSSPAATIAELHTQALLAPYREGKVDIISSLITLQSGEQLVAANCPEMFSLDSSCIQPHDLRIKSNVTIEGIYPNPSHGTTTIVVNANGSPIVKIDVFNAFGRRVGVLHDGVLTDGKHELLIAPERYANGIYFCRIIQEGKVISRKFNVLR